MDDNEVGELMRAALPLPYEPPQMHYLFGRKYKLDADFVVTLNGKRWVVPKGYVTDLATSPRILWQFIPPTGAYEIAAVLHDWMCSDGIRLGLVTSREADAIFRELMRLAGVGFVVRWMMWAAVRCAAPFSKGRRPSQFVLDAPAVLTALGLTAAFVGAVVWGVDWIVHALL